MKVEKNKKHIDNAGVNKNNNAEVSKNIRNRNTVYIAIVLLAIIVTTLISNQRMANMGNTGDVTGTQDAPENGVVQDETLAQDTRQERHDPVQAAVGGNADSGGQASSPGAKFPLKVTDANGDEVIIQSEPKRIISLTLGTDEMLLGLVDKSRITSLTRYSDDEGISNISKEAAEIPERATMDQVEKIISLQPDLVFLDTWVEADYIKQLRDAGINVYAFKTPSNIDEQMAVIKEIARLVGADEKGEEMVKWMNEKLKAVEDKLAVLKPEEKLTVMDYGELGSSGLGTNFDDIVTRAGLVNVVSRAGMTGWPVVSKEKIVEFNPDIIILPSWYYDPNNSLEGMINTLKSDASLGTVNAIKNDRLITVPNQHISAISQYVVLAVEDVAKAAYPELFE